MGHGGPKSSKNNLLPQLHEKYQTCCWQALQTVVKALVTQLTECEGIGILKILKTKITNKNFLVINFKTEDRK